MKKLRKRVNAAFYIRYNYAYVIVNTEDGRHWLIIIHSKYFPFLIG